MNRVYFFTLGCDKNTVDSENMSYLMDEGDFEVVYDIEESDMIVINTCAFINDAKEQSVDAIMQAVAYKQENPGYKIVVVGCLAQRYADELMQEIPEIDHIIGTGQIYNIADIIRSGIKCDISDMNSPIEETGRILSTPEHYAYVKIAEGCNKRCSYCIIPRLRGRQRSRQMEDIIDEVTDITGGGVKEIILVAQDTGEYGTDLYKKRMLPELLRELDKIEDLKWIRLMYVYPETLSDELILAMKECKKVLHYIDIPLQHVNDRILKLMNRHITKDKIVSMIQKLRSAMPDIAIRSTFITGFPTETQLEVDELAEFFRNYRLDRVGVFPYSLEEGTIAAEMDGQIDEEEKTRRFEYLMEVLSEISDEKLEEKIDTILEVIIEEKENEGVYSARSYLDCPEIDGCVYVYTDEELSCGDIVSVYIEDSMEYDLIGRLHTS